MKLSRFLLVAGCAFAVAAPSTQSSAAVVNYSGSFVDMTPVPLEIGQSGTISSNGAGFGNAVLSLITGSLPSNSMVTFTYNFSGTLGAAFLSSNAGYSYTDGGVSYTGFTSANAPLGLDFSVGYENSAPSTALAVASAQIDSPKTATVVIKNFSAGVLSYANAFLGTVMGSKAFTVAYNVSAVPVPAALPLFGLGLGALGLMRRRKQKQELAA